MEVNDGWCDDKANIEICQFDGDDCCDPDKHLMPNAHQFCQDCKCHKGDSTKLSKKLKPGENAAVHLLALIFLNNFNA